MYFLLSVVIIAIAGFLIEKLSKKIRISSVVLLIIFGIIFGLTGISNIFSLDEHILLDTLSEIGLISLMFIAGMEISWFYLYKEKKDSFVIATSAAISAFLLCFILFYLSGFSVLVSLIVGITMSITAEATTASVLLEFGKLKTRIGTLMLGSGIIDDVMGIFLFLLTAYFIFTISSFEEIYLIIFALAAFFIGMAVHRYIGRTNSPVKEIEKLLTFFVVPFFFVEIGIGMDINSLVFSPGIFVLMIIAAIIGKMLGPVISKKYLNLTWKQVNMIGWGMNSRGAVGLALAFIAFQIGIIPVGIYSAVIIVVLVTTLMFPPIFQRILKKNPHVMN